MSNKPPVGLRPRWLILLDRADEIRAAIKRYDEQALICPDEWLIELQHIERQLGILLPKPEQARPKRSILGGLKEEQARIEAAFAEIAAKAEPEPLRGAIPRRFVSVRRTIEPHTIHCHVLDAVADDGTAWWMRLDADADGDEPSWTEILPLPARQEPEF